ncbi:MAG: hypothetical protein PHO48_00625 [Candidatus Gracilibacteria bacterium]|nr:hypothetical protein [Candidatus Gracilibacteria bacterium]MDD5179252.1 hypothetical protein [Candidatus Gracilibacteria bacterium]
MGSKETLRQVLLEEIESRKLLARVLREKEIEGVKITGLPDNVFLDVYQQLDLFVHQLQPNNQLDFEEKRINLPTNPNLYTYKATLNFTTQKGIPFNYNIEVYPCLDKSGKVIYWGFTSSSACFKEFFSYLKEVKNGGSWLPRFGSEESPPRIPERTPVEYPDIDKKI